MSMKGLSLTLVVVVAGAPGLAARSIGGPLTSVEARAMAAASSPAARAAGALRVGVA